MQHPSFTLMAAHGEGTRLPRPGGYVVLSRLPGGRSAIRALAPSLKYVLEGEEVYEINGRSRRLRPGEFLLVEAGSRVEVSTPRPETTTGMCIYFGGGAAAAFVDPALCLTGAIAGTAADPLSPLLDRHARHLARNPEEGPDLAARIVAEAERGASAFLARFNERLERLRSLKYSTRVETLQRVERARAFIHANAGRSIFLEEVAAHAALSRFHLTRSFAEAFGVPPLAYHRSLRLEAAANLLRSDAASATQVSEQLGYASLSAFSRAFRQRFGVPPSRLAPEKAA